jgi:hypothetical protein
MTWMMTTWPAMSWKTTIFSAERPPPPIKARDTHHRD